MKKKLLSIICAICTICMLLPMTISAEDDTTSTYDLWQEDNEIYYGNAGGPVFSLSELPSSECY